MEPMPMLREDGPRELLVRVGATGGGGATPVAADTSSTCVGTCCCRTCVVDCVEGNFSTASTGRLSMVACNKVATLSLLACVDSKDAASSTSQSSSVNAATRRSTSSRTCAVMTRPPGDTASNDTAASSMACSMTCSRDARTTIAMHGEDTSGVHAAVMTMHVYLHTTPRCSRATSSTACSCSVMAATASVTPRDRLLPAAAGPGDDDLCLRPPRDPRRVRFTPAEEADSDDAGAGA